MNFLRARYNRNEIELVKEFVEDYIKSSKLQESKYSLEGLLVAIGQSLREDVNEKGFEEDEQDSRNFSEKGYYIQAKRMDNKEVYLCRGIEGEFDVTENPDRLLVFRNQSFANEVKLTSIRSAKFPDLSAWEVLPIKITKFSDVYIK